MKPIPLSVPCFRGREERYVLDAVRTEWVSTEGPAVAGFESAAARYLGVGRTVACQNGTAGLFLSLKLAGVGPGDEVLVPTLTFIAPVNTVRYLGAEPVFMDCDEWLNMDAEKTADFLARECKRTKTGTVNRRTGRRVKALLPVHVFGHLCRMDQLCSLAGRYGLKVIEDATESLGSRMTTGRFKGRASGTIGEFGVFSFNGNKIITTGGGGLITARQTRQLDRAKYLSTQAKDDAVRYIHNEVGYNLRMTNLEAALGLAQLEQLDGFIRVKARNYRRYASRLSDVPGLRLLTPPPYAEWNHWFYSLETDPKVLPLDRDGLMEALKSKAIQTRPLWYPNHLQKPYRRNQVWRIERAMTAWKRILNLPCSSGLRTEDVDRVCGVILKAVKK